MSRPSGLFGGALPVKYDDGKNPYTSPAMRAALGLYGLHNGDSIFIPEPLLTDEEAALPLEAKLLLIRARRKK